MFLSDSSCRQNIAEMLIAKGSEIDARSKHGFTPLEVAVFNENVKDAELLLEYNANIHNKNNEGKEPRDIAIERSIRFILNEVISLKCCVF